MSSSYYVHVGPYLHCTSGTKPRTEDRLVCSKNKKHEQSSPFSTDKKKFCSECGAPTKVSKIRVSGKENVVNEEDVEDVIGESLAAFNREYSEDGLALYTPNESRKPPREFQIDSDEYQCGEILFVTGDLILQEIEWFSKAFKKEIAAIQKLYGTSNVSIRWGVLGEVM